MINSVLYCLLGHTGGIFIENENGFHINPNIETITSNERESLKRICELGYKYKILDKVSKSDEKILNNDLIKSCPLNKELEDRYNKKETSSIYLNGIYRTINQFLATYRNLIEQLESKYYKDKNLTLYDILVPLNTFFVKMEFIQDLLKNSCYFYLFLFIIQ